MPARVFSAVLVLMTATSCAASPEKAAPKTDRDAPFPVTGATVTKEDIDQSLDVGQRVIIMFQEYQTSAGVKTCPVKIRTVDSVCGDENYQNSDPSVICRVAQDGISDDKNKRIVWFGEGEYTISFEPGVAPCKAPWDGSTVKVWHVCQLEDASVLKIEEGRAAYVKYTVQGPAGCDALDPFFIVRR